MALISTVAGVKTLRTDPRMLIGIDSFVSPQPPYIVWPLHAEYRAGRKYELVKPFGYLSAVPGVGMITVPAGWITDFHSVPRLLWGLFPPDDWAEAAVAHDKLYTTGRSDLGFVNRGQADHVHRECLLYLGAPPARADLMYAGLRLGGWHSWRKHRREDATVAA